MYIVPPGGQFMNEDKVILFTFYRYNLKRKVAELPPVNESDFKNRMSKHEEQRKELSGETKVCFLMINII